MSAAKVKHLPAVPHHGPVFNHVLPAAVALALAVTIGYIFSDGPPLVITNGVASPDSGRPGDKLATRWNQEWRNLCPITITRELNTADGWVTRSQAFTIQPPKVTGSAVGTGSVTVPAVTPGPAGYRAKLEPHCFIDKLWQRHYYSPELSFTVLATK